MSKAPDWASERVRAILNNGPWFSFPLNAKIEELAEALRAERPRWRAIESCPKDKESGSFLAADYRTGEVIEAYWETYGNKTGAVCYVESGCRGAHFTHWMPKPAPPTRECDE